MDTTTLFGSLVFLGLIVYRFEHVISATTTTLSPAALSVSRLMATAEWLSHLPGWLMQLVG